MGCGGFLAAILTTVFVTLKLLGYIEWSWWQVFIPIFTYAALVVFIWIIVVGIALLIVLVKD